MSISTNDTPSISLHTTSKVVTSVTLMIIIHTNTGSAGILSTVTMTTSASSTGLQVFAGAASD